jgi:hypothetical protein
VAHFIAEIAGDGLGLEGCIVGCGWSLLVWGWSLLVWGWWGCSRGGGWWRSPGLLLRSDVRVEAGAGFVSLSHLGLGDEGLHGNSGVQVFFSGVLDLNGLPFRGI